MAWESPLQRGSKSYSHKRRNVRFKGLRRVHTPPKPLTAHTAAYTAKQGRFGRGVVSLPSDRFARFGNPARPGIRAANFAAFRPWLGALPETAESLRNSDALMRVAVPRRRGPAGLRGLFRFCRSCGLYALFQILLSVLKAVELVLLLCKLRLGSFLFGTELFKSFRFHHFV